ncbi:hypothetical protein GOP47_0015915 [Adiantum capillus-veneris]|uniref:Peptidase A1 domain-containing protein n=1 Tax=Adiantum capillus-veneris TaxID=13818 RepID=A0A9D4UL64_ADICA|nr:hypothetical protein GOP47_0015915 [Adiantum capillus-veneris]
MQRALLTCALLLGCAIAVFVLPSCRADTTAARRLLAELRDELRRREGGITFPVYHRSLQNGEYKKGPGQARSTLDTSDIMAAPTPTQINDSNPSNNTIPPDMKSTIVTLNEPFGQFFAVFDIGTPSIDTAVIIDTGSQLLWIQCQPCIECGAQADGYEIFNPNKSTSFSFLRCTTDNECPGDDSVATTCNPNGLCFYHVTYGDKSNSSGYLSRDTLTVGMATLGASASQHKDLLFGCGYINNGIESQLNASGLMGLDRGPFSLITQLDVNVFAHCLPDRIQSTKVSGYLTLGPSPLTSNITLKYTPMIQNNASAFLSQFYYMNMTGISVDGQLLDIPSSAFEISPEGEAGGTIIDSGTTLTSFVEEAFTIVAEAFSLAVDSSFTKADAGNSDLLCYGVPLGQRETPKAPNVTLHFVDNLNLDLNTNHLFRLYGRDTTNNYYCMAFNNAGPIDSGGRNFIGNFQQQNFLVEYDIANSRIGFAPHICFQGSSSGSISVHSIKWLFSWRTLWVIPALLSLIL